MNVFIVIPNWNGEDLIKKCLQSLQNQSIASTIVVVDNGSIDTSVSIITKYFPDVVLIKNEKNHGFSGGVNDGIRYALQNKADVIALFNNDAVADKDWVKNLCSEMQKNPTAGIITGKLLRIDEKHIDSTGEFYTTRGIAFPRGRNTKDKGQYESVESDFGASGGASLYRATMLLEVGLFDEHFFAYLEDVDISFRARLAGWDVMYTPQAIAHHHVGGTSSKLGDFARYHSLKNFLMLYTKCMPARLYWKYLPFFLYQFARSTARAVLDLKLHVWLKSVAVFLAYLPGVLNDRWHIQRSRKLTTEEIEKLLYRARPPRTPTLD